MEGKKISFGFMKTKKADKPLVTEQKEYIECMEEKSIKVLGGNEIQEKAPLIIPLKPNTLITAERLKEIAEEIETAVQEPDIKQEDIVQEEQPLGNESLEQMAVRELLQDAKKVVKAKTESGLAISVPAQPSLDGKKESSLEDYDNIPVQDFGLAMLRGMGWSPGAEKSKYKEPQLRPKGLGLGADKVIKKPKQQPNNDDEELRIVKNAYVKIDSGKYADCYGKVISLDEDNGRAMVDIAVRKETVSLSEFMMHPVTKAEFDKQSRVINSAKYEEYKKKESEPSSSKHRDSPKQCETQKSTKHNTDDNQERSRETDRHANGNKSKRDKHRNSSSPSNDKEHKKKYSSNESLSSDSDKDRRRKHKHNKRRHKTPDSESGRSDSSDRYRKSKKSTHSEGKRDIDKKRKGKKKRRDRDRSPNQRKHRK